MSLEVIRGFGNTFGRQIGPLGKPYGGAFRQAFRS
jgi:hypothetical protein